MDVDWDAPLDPDPLEQLTNSARGHRLIRSGDIEREMRAVLALCPKGDYSTTAIRALAERLRIKLDE